MDAFEIKVVFQEIDQERIVLHLLMVKDLIPHLIGRESSEISRETGACEL